MIRVSVDVSQWSREDVDWGTQANTYTRTLAEAMAVASTAMVREVRNQWRQGALKRCALVCMVVIEEPPEGNGILNVVPEDLESYEREMRGKVDIICKAMTTAKPSGK